MGRGRPALVAGSRAGPWRLRKREDRTKRGPGAVRKLDRDPRRPGVRTAMRALRLGGRRPRHARAAQEALDIDASCGRRTTTSASSRTGTARTTPRSSTHEALAVNKAHTPSLLARAEAHRRAGHKRDARTDYEAALRATEEDDPSRRDASARLASMLRDAGEYDDAVTLIRETIRLHGVNAKIYTELGLIYIQQKRPELAQLVLAKALELDAKDPAIYNALAMLRAAPRQGQEAFQLSKTSGGVARTRPYIEPVNKATVLLDAGDHQRAKAELSAIVGRLPDDYRRTSRSACPRG